jgi:hypothetical protein
MAARRRGAAAPDHRRPDWPCIHDWTGTWSWRQQSRKARRLSLKGFGVGVSAGPLGAALMPDTAWAAVSPPDGPFQALMVAI